MNENERQLLEGLHALAADGPRQAPASVEERLLAEFRRRSKVRRMKLWSGISGAAAIAAGLAVMLWMHPAATQPAAATEEAGGIPGDSAADEELAMRFYPLPAAEELPPVESATVVRVQLQMSSLRLIGFPVSEERAGERIQADVLLGQDGLARGVRFVQ